MKKEYLEIGKIVGVHALKGELRFQYWCDSPDFVRSFSTLYFDENGRKPIGLLNCRGKGNIAILRLEGIDTPEKAQTLRNKVLYMKRSDASLPEGFYFISELSGCKVIDADDEKRTYGTLTDVFQTGANDVWQITDDKDYLIPAIPDVVDSVDINSGIIKIRPLKGIFDGEVNGDED